MPRDAVLRTGATRTANAVRGADSVDRWGGDELVAVLDSTDRRTIDEPIQRVREAVEAPTREETADRLGTPVS